MQPDTEKNYKSGHFYKILVIDDDRNICTLVQKALKKNGYDLVDTAYSAEEAVEKMGISLDFTDDGDEFIPYKLIITDVLLGGVNGFELCKKLKKLRPDIFVILVSGHDIFSMHKKITESGADDFIAKPFNLYELIVRVDMLLQKANGEAAVKRKKTINTTPNKLPYINDVIGSYLIVDFIAYGKSTLIFKTINLQNDSFYALKILSPNSTNFDELVTRFEKEIEIMEKFNHPNIIKFYDRGYSNGLLYLVMEYLDGVDLEGLLIAKGRLSEKMLYSIAFDMACAIAEVHDKGILHREIKLKNLIY
jgi:CheY-like chemotaxis protein